ncbi:Malate/L-lactate dehydrogenase [Aspergillus caelatus]|uniref:Malate/L-lactate dehydrogenase n=1 Tax=Aspergillus caelatus TaxID=61420 RepID=A0A5N6ZR80_9EURO|nr:Malate/L-lactate dehydrogenase [Aspergillus caelatus]KAE8359703.1 Malate/L-lactate dehydrogenase [Aspergillus caelatus]
MTTIHPLAKAILTSHGVPADRAELIATALILADLRGVDTHGINRLPGYIARLQAGVVAPAPELTFHTKTPTMALLDAKNTFRLSTTTAWGLRTCCVSLSRGFTCFAYTNASRAMMPWGGAEALLGTSPFAVGVPGGVEGDFVLDMSSCGTWFCRLGGPKGSGLAMMMDIFSGVMSGAAFARGEEFRERMDTLLRTVRGVKKVEGFERIYVSGRMEAEVEERRRRRRRRRRDGIPFTKAEVDALHYLGLQSGVQIKMEEMSKTS